MVDPKKIKMADYSYELPSARIAQYPIDQRDQSKVLIFKKNQISENIFFHIDQYLPEESLLIFNNTKVIRARLLFQKSTGAKIEIFCLEPAPPTGDLNLAFQNRSLSYWKCLVGNSKKWKTGALTRQFVINNRTYILKAERIQQQGSDSIIKFSWDSKDETFSSILEHTGVIPIPPYINREAVESDTLRYQTIYARHDGSVAAPTAGLHFSEPVFNNLEKKNIKRSFVTLHVTAGTFLPVNSSTIGQHDMHIESIVINRSLLNALLYTEMEKIVAVGTTSMRTLESIYWYGVKLATDRDAQMLIGQWDPYESLHRTKIQYKEAILNILNYMDRNETDTIYGATQLIIIPGYTFRIVNGLITNFHMPKSTLLLLVAAFVGEKWQSLYQYALNNDFRFLSYGDSCLFLR